MNEIITVGLPFVGGLISGFGGQLLKSRFDRQSQQLQTSGQIHQADLDYDSQLMEKLMERLQLVEVGLAQATRDAREQDKKISGLELKLERVGHQYEANRKLQRRVAMQLRDGKDIDEATLKELEEAPDFAHVLAGPSVLPSQNGPVGSPT